MADMALVAPFTVAATIEKATALKGDAAQGVPAGRTRYFIEAHADALIAGRAELPEIIRYLADLPTSKKTPKLKGQQVLLLAAPGARPGEIRLIGPKAQIARTTADETRLRAILKAAIAPDAPPAVTGIGHAFHVAGSLPGEGETQIFLKTPDNRPISLSILRRPGETPRWAVALSELTDASAEPPAPETLLWYRLACGLPRALPQSSVDGLQPNDATIAAEDYQTVLKGLGPCRGGQKEAISTPTP
ncbi:hypothetical protein HL653_10185 [Sphingomonas sp. AP4-R1]|uniref:hypothetical protein n=1 Tax=Sphingomonas sp. AP4-R1 TaxID=2735134 RepID=UPI0014934EDE|nr:hypothetical protein [Sphingomonas sp. AP4-R1]QJU58118.1 hypothetical protein HL653_10185 [Sphingomonas sp. AP4-R1]